MSCRLIRTPMPDIPEAPPGMLEGHRGYLHVGPGKTLIAIFSIDNLSYEDAHTFAFGIRRWRHLSVSVQGALDARLADQRKIGRERGPGERSPAPLPGWYDLTHLVYEHPELGFDRAQDVYQRFPAPNRPYLNIAEALHLLQPA